MKLLNLGCGRHYHPAWINVDFHSVGPGVISHNLYSPLPFAGNSFDVVYHSHVLEHFPRRYAPVFIRECFRILKVGGVIRVVVPDFEQLARLYLDLLAKALQGDGEAQERYAWITIEMFDQMVRNEPGGEMLRYWRQDPMPAESFVLERSGSEIKIALDALRNSSAPRPPEPKKENGFHDEADSEQVGRFRLAGEVHQWMYDRYSLGVLLRDAGFQDIRVCRADESCIPNLDEFLLDLEAGGSIRKPDSLFMEAKKPKEPG
jgi:predicted SAM-dependent methyltransferase